MLAEPERGVAVALIGYPGNGPLSRIPGRLGGTSAFVSRDAYGQGPVNADRDGDSRSRTARALGRAGLDASGRVRTTVFARRPAGRGGYGIPAELVRKVLAEAQGTGRRSRPTAQKPRGARRASPLREQLERGERLPEGRDEVDAPAALARLSRAARGERKTLLARVRARVAQPRLDVLRHDDPGNLVVQAERELVALDVEDPDEERDRAAAAEPPQEVVEVE